jgi:hypothetical protein
LVEFYHLHTDYRYYLVDHSQPVLLPLVYRQQKLSFPTGSYVAQESLGKTHRQPSEKYLVYCHSHTPVVDLLVNDALPAALRVDILSLVALQGRVRKGRTVVFNLKVDPAGIALCKINYFEGAVIDTIIDEYIGGFDIPVDHPPAVQDRYGLD